MVNDDERRPYPPVNFIASDNWQPYTRLIPANEVHEWVSRQILSDAGSIHNPDHEHLLEADLCFMWASDSFAKKGRYVLGQAEQVMLRAGGWQKARMGESRSSSSRWLPITAHNAVTSSSARW